MEQLDQPQSMKFAPTDALAGMPEEVKDVPLGPMVGVAAIALNMAMKYHDISTVQDGTLYQQYKLEGRNFRELHIDMVFETAIQIEYHLVGANKRVAKMLVLAALDDGEPADEIEGATAEPEPDQGDTTTAESGHV